MAISTIVAISRSPLPNNEVTQFQNMEEKDRLVLLFSRDPAAQGVHPGESVYIYVLDVRELADGLNWPAPNFKVYSVQPELLLVSEPKTEIFKDLAHRYVQVEVHVPGFDQLQGWDSYATNPALMWLQFRIGNLAGTHSPDSIPIPIWKSWPVIVAISRSEVDINEFKKKNNDIERAVYLIGRDPAALGVYPGDLIFFYVLDFNPGAQGGEYRVSPVLLNLANGLVVEGQNPILTDPFRTYVQIQVRVPTLDQLQTSKNYESNALMMGLQFQVESPSGGTSWNSLPILVWMPWPQVKVWDWDTTMKVVRVGTSDPPISGGTGTGAEITRFLGLPSDSGSDPKFGQVRWYGIRDIPKLPSAPDFINLEKTFGPDGKQVVVLPPAIHTLLHEIRDKGTFIHHQQWTDSYVEFKPPSDPVLLPGVAILWRDDLPSRPIVDVQDLANQLWRLHASTTMEEENIFPIPLGQIVTLGVERLAEAANNLLAEFLERHEGEEPKIQVSFAFLVQPYKASKFEWNDLKIDGPQGCIGSEKAGVPKQDYDSDFEPGRMGVSDLALGLRIRPRASVTDKPSLEQSGAFTIQLSVRIWGEFFEKPIDLTLNVGVPLVFRPEPLILPTMAIFFEHPNLQGAPLVMFPKDMFGMPGALNGKHFDDNTPFEKDAEIASFMDIKREIGQKLQFVHDQLSLLREILKLFNEDVTCLDAVSDVLGRIWSATKMVFNSTGYIADLGAAVFDSQRGEIMGISYDLPDKSFGRQISSVILIGVPYEWSGIRVNCYDGVNGQGNKLALGLSHNCYMAAVADLRNLGAISSIPPFGLTLALPYIGVGTSPGLPPFKEFDDKIASIEIGTR